MIVLGLNAFGHDAAAVLVIDGTLVFASSEERYDRRRHSPAFPEGAIHAALARAGLEPRDVDAVAFPWTRGMARGRKLLHVLRHLPRSRAFLRDAPDSVVPDRRGYLQAMRGLERTLRARGFRAPVRRIPHHRAHAASAALALPEGRGAILTADGMGEWATAATWRAEGHELTILREAHYPHSPGKTYAAVTQWLGFVPESDEGKTMGLAAYGDPDSAGAAFTRGLLRADPEHLVRVDTRRLGFPWGEARLYGEAFLEALGPAGDGAGPDRPGDADAARGIQDAAEAFALAAARAALAESGMPRLAVAGGFFLNCAVNGVLRRAGIDLHPFPVGGDAGAAWGAASEVHRLLTGRPAEPLAGLDLGHEITTAEAETVAATVGMQHLEDESARAAAVAERIAAGRIVCVARGRAEFGPRALGHRSVLASPTALETRDRVNALKGREAWRPVAPIVRAADAHWFREAGPSPHMILTFEAIEDARRALPGVVHADGTARVQTVTPAGDPFLCRVLDALEARGHPPALVNTSFNRRGEPIVNTAVQALEAWQAMGYDSLLLDAWLHDRPA